MSIINWFRGLTNQVSRTRRSDCRRPNGRRRAAIEQLEDRMLLAGPQYSDFTSIALFHNLANRSEIDNLSGYQATTAETARTWLRTDEPLTTSEFVQNYWDSLSYGRFSFDIDAARNDAGNFSIPTLNTQADQDNGKAIESATDYWSIASQLISRNAENIWEQAWSNRGEPVEENGVRIIPSVVLVHNHGAGGMAWWGGNSDVVSGGKTYRVLTWFRMSTTVNEGLDARNASGHPANWATVIHEYAHNFLEFGDLYGQPLGKIGYWDLLGDSSSGGVVSDTSSYFKERVNWIDNYKAVLNGPMQLPSSWRLKPYATSGEALKIVPDPVHNPGEFFLIEYRTSTDSTPWTPDGALEEGGLLITHVNEASRGYGAQAAMPVPFMDIEEADGHDGKSWYPEGDLHNFGDLPWSDPWGARGLIGEAEYQANNWPSPNRPAGVLFPLDGSKSFTPNTSPSSDLYGDRPSGLYVTNIRRVGNEAVFTVELRGTNTSVYTRTANDQYYVADISGDGKDEVIIYNGSELLFADVDQSQLHVTRRLAGSLGSWTFSTSDKLHLGDFNDDGREDLLVHSGYHMYLFLSNGQSLMQVWSAQASVGGWRFGPDDELHVGDFDGDGRDDLFLRNGTWAGLLTSTGDGFQQTWIVDGQIGSWRLGTDNQHFVGDFTGDGRDDIFIRSPEWAGLLASNGRGFQQIWMVQDQIGGWRLGIDNEHFVGDFNGDGLDDIFIRSPEWAGLLTSNGTSLVTSWAANETIGGWRLGIDNWHSVGDFNHDGRDDVFIRSPGWGGILTSTGNGLEVEWMSEYGRVNNWGLGAADQQIVGHFNYDRYADLFVFNPQTNRAAIFFTARYFNSRDAKPTRFVPQTGWMRENDLLQKDASLPDIQFVGNFSGDDKSDVLVRRGDELALFKNTNGNLHRIWQSGPYVGDWRLSALDRLIIGDFTGNGRDDIFIRNDFGQAALLRSTGSGFTNIWSTDQWIGGWHLGNLDREYVGDFTGDGNDDIFIRSPQWAGLLKSTGSGFTNPWTVNDRIGQWSLGPQDQIVVGDFDGAANGQDEILIRSPNWAGLLRWTGTQFVNPWIVSEKIGNYDLSVRDRHYVGDFTGDGRDDVLMRDGSQIQLARWVGTEFQPLWADFDGEFRGWTFSTTDQEVVGDFNHDGLADVFMFTPPSGAELGRTGLLTSTGSVLDWAFIEDGRIGTWPFNPMDRLQTGRFYDADRDEFFVSHPGGWTGVFRAEGQGSTTSYISRTQAHFEQLTAEHAQNPAGTTQGGGTVVGTNRRDVIEVNYRDSSTATVDVTLASASSSEESFSYIVDTSSGIHIEAAGGNDEIHIDARVNADITVRGMGGASDELFVHGFGELIGSYQADDLGYDGTIRAGAATIRFKEIGRPIEVDDIVAFTVYLPLQRDEIKIDNWGAAVQVAGFEFVDGTRANQFTLAFSQVSLLVVDGATHAPSSGDDVVDVDFTTSTDVGQLLVQTGGGVDTFWVRATASDTTTILSSSGPFDQVHLGKRSTDAPNAHGRLSSVDGDIQLFGSGPDWLFLHDGASNTDNTYTLNETSLQHSGDGEVRLTGGASLLAIELTAGTGDDTIDINGTHAATPVVVSGGDGEDTFRLNEPPSSSVTVNGGAPDSGIGDSLVLIGTALSSGRYEPTEGSLHDGTIEFDGQDVHFTGLEPVIVSGFARFELTTPGSQDDLIIDSPQAQRSRIHGTSDGVGFESLIFFDVAELTIDTATNDGANPDDRIIVEPDGLSADGLQQVILETGAGNDYVDYSQATVPVAALPGDADSSGATDLSDFNIWNAYKFTAGTVWSTADFNGDGITDLSDFNIWNAHKFTSAPAPPVVHDAIFEQAAVRGPESSNLGEAVWLQEFERTLLHRREDNDGNRVEETVDKLLATYWP